MTPSVHAPGGIDFDRLAIGELLHTKRLVVPVFQRAYSWETVQVEEFWEDLNAAVAEARPAYFLGTVVLTPDDSSDRLAVIDGQQRLATATLILAAIRDELHAGNLVEDGQLLFSDYIATRKLGSSSLDPKLLLNAEDESFFRSIVNSPAAGSSPKPAAPVSHKRIATAYALIAAKVKELVAARGSKWPDALYRWVEYLKERAQVIAVIVSTEADAFLIFETLNDRGLDLTVADLLKNHLFRLSGENIESVKRSWTRSEAFISQSGDRTPFIVFLRHDWTARFGLARERDLYRSMRQVITDQQSASTYSQDLQVSANFYLALLSRDHEFWTEKGNSTKSDIDTLRRLRVEQVRPLLLAVLQRFSDVEVEKAIKAIVSWSVRSLVTATAGSGPTEKGYASAALAVMKGKVADTTSLFSHLDGVIPSDSDFEGAFQRIKPIARLARYYLLAIERQVMGTSDPELIPNADADQVNLEHVLPKRPVATDWPSFSSQELEDYPARLGNFVLMRSRDNQRLGNSSFVVKKPVLSQSTLQLTKEVGDEAIWTSQEIEQRQERLARLASQTWRRRP